MYGSTVITGIFSIAHIFFLSRLSRAVHNYCCCHVILNLRKVRARRWRTHGIENHETIELVVIT
jgi:hypothetical protein